MKQLFYNAHFITVNDAQPVAEALLVEDGKIIAVGSYDRLSEMVDTQTEKIDLQGNTVLPGFYDGHGHITSPLSGLSTLFSPPNGVVNSIEALCEQLRKLLDAQNLLDNGWLVASGYDNAFFDQQKHPTRAELDSVSRDVPILVLHASGHVGAVNSKALEIVGWDNDTPNPEGGVLQRDPLSGALTGVIEEKAVQIIGFQHVLPSLSAKTLTKMLLQTQDFYASVGVTTAQEGGANQDVLKIMQYCQEQGLLKIDLAAYILQEYDAACIPDDSAAQSYDRHLKIAGAKVVGDGSPQAKTAWLTEPYYEKPEGTDEGYRGYPIYTAEQMYQFCKEAMGHHWQLMVHCNGDAMSDQFITCYRQALQDTGTTMDLRPVMIHAQTVREDQLDSMKELGIMPSFFNDHVFYWGDYHYESVFGPVRGSRISPLASAVHRKMPFTLHNDMPVTPINPIFCIHNAVNRVTREGRVLGPEYCIDVMEAIKAVTIYGAYQYFDDHIKGSLEIGKLADMVVLDQNPLTVPKNKIKDIKVLETIKEGQSIYKAE